MANLAAEVTTAFSHQKREKPPMIKDEKIIKSFNFGIFIRHCIELKCGKGESIVQNTMDFSQPFLFVASPIDPSHKWRLYLNNNILSLTFMRKILCLKT